MRINHNLMAMNTNRQLGIANKAGAKSMEKLSSGFKINRAADDAAGLSISEKMRNQIRGLDRASANSQDGISLIQTAEGALDETHAILKRMRELTVQAGNEGTLQQDDLEAIRDEFGELASELDGISERTEFNGKKLLDGKYTGTLQIGANQTQQLDLDVDVKEITGSEKQEALNGKVLVQGRVDAFTKTDDDSKLEVTADKSIKSIKFVQGAAGDAKVATKVENNGGEITVTIGNKLNETTGKYVVDEMDLNDLKVALAGEKTTENLYLDIKSTEGKDVKFTTQDIKDINDVAKGAKDVKAGGSTSSKDLGVNISKDKLGEGEDLKSVLKAGVFFGFEGMSQADVKMSTDANLERLDGANKAVSKVRSHLGANQNRLEHTIKNLDNAAENIQASEARIRDVDMAKEMIENTKQNILQQASTAMLAQANQAPQSVLRLLG